MLKLKTPIFWPPNAKNWLFWKDPHAGKDWRQEEKGTTEDELVGWHQQMSHEFEQTPGAREGQGSLACCSPWGCKEFDMTSQLSTNSTNWVMEAKSLRSKCEWGWFLLRAGRERLFHSSPLVSGGLLAIFGAPWLTPPVCLSVSRVPRFIRMLVTVNYDQL